MALSFVLYFIIGTLQLIVEKMNPGTFVELGLATPTFLSSIVIAPLVGGLLGYLFVLFAILLYNFMAKKYPISWKASKK